MQDIRVYVITHKECVFPQIEGYVSLLVGAHGKRLSQQFDCYDNDGDSISEKNPSYCELTGLYWIWKNTDSDIAGLCHYRRFFSTAKLSMSPAYFLTVKQIEKIMEDHDVILPVPLVYPKSIRQSVRVAPNRKDLEEMREALARVSPEYLPDYDAFLNQRTAYLFNMCVMKKRLLDDYCQWIFSVLADMEARHDMSVEAGYRSRLFGFLSERLIYVWIAHNIPRSRVKEMRVVKTDETLWEQLSKEAKNGLKKTIFRR